MQRVLILAVVIAAFMIDGATLLAQPTAVDVAFDAVESDSEPESVD